MFIVLHLSIHFYNFAAQPQSLSLLWHTNTKKFKLIDLNDYANNQNNMLAGR
jgi:hypothetical protein